MKTQLMLILKQGPGSPFYYKGVELNIFFWNLGEHILDVH